MTKGAFTAVENDDSNVLILDCSSDHEQDESTQNIIDLAQLLDQHNETVLKKSTPEQEFVKQPTGAQNQLSQSCERLLPMANNIEKLENSSKVLSRGMLVLKK